MYTPRTFREHDRSTLYGLISEYGFATLCTHSNEGLLATHIPLILEDRYGEPVLTGHMARANPHWRSFDGGSESLAIFLGPHAYISPSWYTSAKDVPTWNYAAVHAYGVPRIIEDRANLREQIERLTERYERRFAKPWLLENVEGLEDQLFRALVGFEIPVTRLEGKWKFNQNRSREDRIGVIVALRTSEDALERAASLVMERQLLRESREGGPSGP